MTDAERDDATSPATAAARALLEALLEAGVEHVVVSPGSRSQALALAAARLERHGRLRLHVRIDERVAGFTALGIGRESARPAVVVCTSGTAVGNLLPSLMEAHHAGVPMIVLTADRPPELRGVGANQTTRQPGIFGDFVRLAADAPTPEGASDERARAHDLAREAWRRARGVAGVAPGPVHLNLPYREPLSGGHDVTDEPSADGASARVTPPVDPGAVATITAGPRTVVIAGADAGPDAEELAHRGGWPLIAEIVSGARFGRRLVHGYQEALRDPALGGRVERALVLGHPTLTREVTGLLSRPDVEVIARRSGGEDLDLNGRTRTVDDLHVVDAPLDRTWLGEWMRFSQAHMVDLAPPAPDAEGLSSTDPRARRDAVRAELEAVRQPLDRAQLVAAVWGATWPHDRLVFGSSRLVRVADAVLPGKKVPVHANRGLAGIDGTIATAMGVAIASRDADRSGVTRVLLGDLAFLHDAGALLLPDGEVEPRVQVIVGNDGGGTIFDGLEVARTAPRDDFTRVQYTPQSASLADLAAAYGWAYARVTTRGALDQALTRADSPRQIIEVPLAR